LLLKQADAGMAVKDLCWQAGIGTATDYQWKSKYGGVEASDLRRVRELDADNAAMKDLIAQKL
jgi:putative transposase